MAHSIMNRLRGKLAAFIALAAALVLVPATAFAEPVAWTGASSANKTITVTGLQEGETVEFIQVASIDLGDDNVTSYTANEDNFTKSSVDTYLASTGSASDAAELVKGLQTGYSASNTKTADGNGSVTSDSLPAGVYYIKVTAKDGFYYNPMVAKLEPQADLPSSWTLDDTSLVAKGSSTEVTKKIVASDGTEVDSTNAGIGDTVNFKITFHIPEGQNEFTVTDTMLGLEYTTGSLTINGVAASNYTVTSLDDNHGFTIEFTGTYLAGIKTDTTLTATYSATVCGDDATAADGASNSVTTTNGGSDTTKVTFGKAGIFKFGDSNTNGSLDSNEPALGGAVFQLFDANGNPIQDTNQNYVYIKTGDDGYANTVDDRCNADGSAVTNAGEVFLKVGDTVQLKEIVAPSGYKLPADEDNSFTTTVVAMDASEETERIEVPNEPSGYEQGVQLPTTGGMGTIAFTAAGVVIVAGAAAFLIRSRKQNN